MTHSSQLHKFHKPKIHELYNLQMHGSVTILSTIQTHGKVPSPAMNLMICSPLLVTNMNTYQHRYRKTVSCQTSLITGPKIITNKIMLADEYINTHKKS